MSISHVTSLVDEIYDLLYGQIIAAKIPQGEKIVESEIARSLGVSRNPIREAIRRLEGTGLLVNRPRRGRFVRQITRDDVIDIFHFRTCIETFYTRVTTLSISRSRADELRALMHPMYRAASRNDAVAFIEADVSFHRRICEMSGSRRALRAFDTVYAEIQMVIGMIGLSSSELGEAAAAHEPIVEAICSGNADVAIVRMSEHIATTQREALEHFE